MFSKVDAVTPCEAEKKQNIFSCIPSVRMWKNESGIVQRNKNTPTVIFARITNNKALAVGRKRCVVQVHTATIKQRYNVGAMQC